MEALMILLFHNLSVVCPLTPPLIFLLFSLLF